ncbi:MAG: hypothetical protein ABIO70_01720 [Pseudomonadota bacterium]
MRSPPLSLLLAALLGACHEDEPPPDDTGSPPDDTLPDPDPLTQQADDVAGSVSPDVVLEVAGEATVDLGEPASLDGTLHYVFHYGVDVDCDAHIALHGTAYTGFCHGCDFAFTTAAEVIDGEDCAYFHPFWSLLPGDQFDRDLVLAWVSHTEAYGYTFYDTLAIGYPSGLGVGWYPLVYASPQMGERGEGSYEDGVLSWSYAYTGSSYAAATYYQLCDGDRYAPWSEATAPYGATLAGSSTLPCDGEEMLDVWTVQAEAGQSLAVTVDTLGEATAFDPWFWVNSPSQCTRVYANDNFACSYPPPYWGWCPSALVEVGEAGTWQVVVGAYGCAGDVGEYEVRVELR